MSHFTPRGAADLPIIGTKGAPKKFKGRSSEVETFLQHYEKLCTKYDVTDAHEKIESITQYCSRTVREFLEGLITFKGTDWELFKQDFKEFYNADKDDRRFRCQDLDRYVIKSRKNQVSTLALWREYTRGYIRIAGWLLAHKKITTDQYDTSLWQGIHQTFRDRLEQRLMSQEPDHDLSQPFKAEAIERNAKALLRRDRFDLDRLPEKDDSDNEEEDDESSDSNDEESDSDSDSDSDDDTVAVKKASKKKTTKRKARSSKSSKSSKTSSRTSSKERKAHRSEEKKSQDSDNKKDKENGNGKTKKEKENGKKTTDKIEEVEKLINKLNRMSIDDPSYPALYFRACQMSPLAQQCLKSPLFGQRPKSAPPQPVGPMRDKAAPSTMPAPRFMAPRTTMCYGCGETGHGMYACPILHDMEARKIIKRDNQGRWAMYDGSRIYRQEPTEPLAVAARRQIPVQSHYVTVDYGYSPENEEEYMQEAYPVLPQNQWLDPSDDEVDDDDSDDDSEADAYYGDHEGIYAFEADRPTRAIRNARKEQFDGVYVPPRRKQPEASGSKGKGKASPKFPQETRFNPSAVDAQQPIYVRPEDDDVQMRDDIRTAKPVKQPPGVKKPNRATTEKEGPKERHTRQSQLQVRVNPPQLVEQALATPFTTDVGTVLGASKETAQVLQDLLKPRTISRPQVNFSETAPPRMKPLQASSFVTRARGTLIRLRMECDGTPISAIIDTGSQLNIASKRTWKGVIGRPMDIRRSIRMNDANGGEGVLSGFIPDVPLVCGGVLTHASIFIGEKAPFDLLLGRPWQRGNYVSIDERRDGTYLVFKDKSMEARYELLVLPEHTTTIPSDIADYLQTFGAVTSLMVNIASGIPAEESSEEGEITSQKRRRKIMERELDTKSLIQELATITSYRTYGMDDPMDEDGPSRQWAEALVHTRAGTPKIEECEMGLIQDGADFAEDSTSILQGTTSDIGPNSRYPTPLSTPSTNAQTASRRPAEEGKVSVRRSPRKRQKKETIDVPKPPARSTCASGRNRRQRRRRGAGKTARASAQDAGRDEDAEMLEAAYVLVSMAAGDQEEGESTHQNLLEPSLNRDKASHDACPSTTSTPWTTELNGSVSRAAIASECSHVPITHTKEGSSPHTAAPIAIAASSLGRSSETLMEIRAIQDRLAYLSLRLQALQDPRDATRERRGIEDLREEGKSENDLPGPLRDAIMRGATINGELECIIAKNALVSQDADGRQVSQKIGSANENEEERTITTYQELDSSLWKAEASRSVDLVKGEGSGKPILSLTSGTAT